MKRGRDEQPIIPKMETKPASGLVMRKLTTKRKTKYSLE